MMNGVHGWCMKNGANNDDDYCVILECLKNINYVMETQNEASKGFNQLTTLMYCTNKVSDTIAQYFQWNY